MSSFKKLLMSSAGGAEGDYYATWSENDTSFYGGSAVPDGAETYLFDRGYANISGTNRDGLQNLVYADDGSIPTYPFYYGQSADIEVQFFMNDNNNAVMLGSDIYATSNAYRLASPAYDGACFSKFTGTSHQFSKVVSQSGYGDQINFSAIGTDGTDLYCAGTENKTTGNSAAWLVSFDTSGTINWQKAISTTGLNFESPQAVRVDSSGNLIVMWLNRYNGIGGRDFYIAKFNSSGTVQWQKYYGTTQQDYPINMWLDSSDNIYLIFGYVNAFANVAKLNSSGTVQWSKMWRYHNVVLNVYDGATDPDGNTYVVGRNYATRGSGARVQNFRIKIDSTGSLEFAEEWYNSATSTYGFDGTAVNEFGSNLCWSVNTPKDASGYDTLMAKLPPDVQTNTFGNITCYDETSGWDASESNLTLSTSTPTYTWATPSGLGVQRTLNLTSGNHTIGYSTDIIT